MGYYYKVKREICIPKPNWTSTVQNIHDVKCEMGNFGIYEFKTFFLSIQPTPSKKKIILRWKCAIRDRRKKSRSGGLKWAIFAHSCGLWQLWFCELLVNWEVLLFLRCFSMYGFYLIHLLNLLFCLQREFF